MLLGILIGSSRLAYDVAYPLLVGFSSIPKVAVVPIFVLWFGAGTVPAVLTAMIMCIFPIVVNVATGLAATEPELQDVMRTLRATKWEILWNIGLPRTMPYFFASLKVAATLAFVGAVISETVASNRGIGNLMMIASSSFDVPLVFAGLFILAALGVALYAGFSLIEGRVTGWAVRSETFTGGGKAFSSEVETGSREENTSKERFKHPPGCWPPSTPRSSTPDATGRGSR